MWAGASKADTPWAPPGGQEKKPRLPGLAVLSQSSGCLPGRPPPRCQALGPFQPWLSQTELPRTWCKSAFALLSSWTVSWGSVPWHARPAAGAEGPSRALLPGRSQLPVAGLSQSPHRLFTHAPTQLPCWALGAAASSSPPPPEGPGESQPTLLWHCRTCPHQMGRLCVFTACCSTPGCVRLLLSRICCRETGSTSLHWSPQFQPRGSTPRSRIARSRGDSVELHEDPADLPARGLCSHLPMWPLLQLHVPADALFKTPCLAVPSIDTP